MEISSSLPNTAKPVSPLCSVCIANYNGESFIEQCINSILRQKGFPGEIEIIVHDDASTDGSVALIKSRYPQVRLLPSQKNKGFCISNNRMVAAAHGKFILLLNNDAHLAANALKTLYDASIMYGDGIYGLPQYNVATGDLIDMGSVFDLFLNPVPNTDADRDEVGMVIGACLWLPKKLWDTLGGFPEWFGSLAEDMYLCCFARLMGFPVKIIPSSRFYHWVGKSLGGGKILNNMLSTTFSRRAMSERNKCFVMLACYPAVMAWFIIPWHFILLIIEGILLTIIKIDNRVWLQIYWLCLKGIWEKRTLWLKQRRIVQHARLCSSSQFLSTFTLVPHKMRMLLTHGLPILR
jgi:GT2 family glycosyltransferase